MRGEGHGERDAMLTFHAMASETSMLHSKSLLEKKTGKIRKPTFVRVRVEDVHPSRQVVLEGGPVGPHPPDIVVGRHFRPQGLIPSAKMCTGEREKMRTTFARTRMR